MEREEKLKNILSLLADSVNKEEFVKAFKTVVQHVQTLEVKVLGKVDEKLGEAVSKVKNGADGKDGKNGRDGKDGRDGRDGVDGRDGKDADEQKILNALKSQVPSEEKIKEKVEGDLPQFGEKFVDGIMLLEEGNRLPIEAVDGLEEALKAIQKIKGEIKYVPNGSSGGGIVKAYDLSSSLDGSTKTFALPAFWRIISVHLSSFPNILRPTVDFTSDAGAMTITFTSEIDAASSLASGQTLIIVYAEP